MVVSDNSKVSKEPSEDATTYNQIAVEPKNGWNLSFNGPDAPKPIHLPYIQRWDPIPSAKGFSGEGSYEAEFDLPALRAHRILLGLSDIHNAATVLINGHLVGNIWTPPLELDITRFIHAGTNRVELRVYNSMANRFISLPAPDMTTLRAKYGARFQAPEEKQLMKEPDPSGIAVSPYLKIYPRIGRSN